MARPHWFVWLAGMLLVPVVAHAFPNPQSGVTVLGEIPNEILIGYREGASESQRATVRGMVGGVVKRRYRFVNVELVQLPSMTTQQGMAALSDHPDVDFVEPNYRFQIALEPNDPLFGQQWSLKNLGQAAGTVGADIHATAAWNVTTGNPDVMVGVIDTGVDWTHPDLAPNIWTNPGEIPGNSIDDDDNGYIDDIHGFDFVSHDGNPMDDHGHGTHVSGTIAAVGNNGIGITGVNWRAKIVGIKFLDAIGIGSTERALEAIEYAMVVGVRLTNSSWGGGVFSTALQNLIQVSGNMGQLFVAAAGNAANDNDLIPFYPASYPCDCIVSVAATNNRDQLASFSNYGRTSVDLAAPGDDILSTVPGGFYLHASGTSMASPHVTGVLALLWGRRPNLTAAQAKSLLLNGTDSLPALNGRVLTGGRLNALLAVADPDSLPPGTITDLSATLPTSTTVLLSWHATGDDGNTGRASSYEIRYSTTPITPANFANANPFPGPFPRDAGQAEQVEVTALQFSTHYYFALRALDEFGNAGAISNVAQSTTLGAPHIGVTPSSFAVTLPAGSSTHRTLGIRNTGQGTLDFTIPNPRIHYEPVAVHPYIPAVQGVADLRRGTPVTLGAGGPDGYGYRWTDSDEVGGPAFAWEDILESGSPIDLTGDESVATSIPIGFTFPFYGSGFTSVNVGVNGWLSFTSTANPTYANQPLPSVGFNVPENLVAPLWSDLYFGSTNRAYVLSEADRLVVSWIAVPHVYSGAPHTFQVILMRNGEIRYQYLSVPPPTDSVFTPATVGIQNGSRTDGLTVAFNTPYVRSGLAVRISPPANWLTVTPDSGRVAAGQTQNLDLHFDAAFLVGGTYLADLFVQSNDPDDSTVTIPVRLDATGTPDIHLDVTTLDFGSQLVGGVRLDTVLVHNPGTDSLRVAPITSSSAAFIPAQASLVVPPFGTRRLQVRFAPLALGPVSGTLTLPSNDPDEPVKTVQLTGVGAPPPDIAVTPDSLDVTVTTEGTATRTVRVDNTGIADLSVVVSVTGALDICATCDTLRPAPRPPDDPEAWLVRRGHGRREEWDFTPSSAATGARNAQPTPPPVRVQNGYYGGTSLAFGVSDLGELMPFQQPIGNEHLAVGTWTQGYGLGALTGGVVSYYFTAYAGGNDGIIPESYQELLNTPALVVVRVVTRTTDSRFRIQRDFTFPRNDKYVSIETRITNLGAPVDSIVFKEFSDWDMDGDYQDDTFDYDYSRNLVLARDVTFAGTTSSTLARLDLLGWDSYFQYPTYVDVPNGPVGPVDGLALLHFDLGPLAAGDHLSVVTAHCAGNDLAELRAVVDRASPITRWLTAEPETLVVPPGGHRDVTAHFNPAGLLGGSYRAHLSFRSNDPDEPDVRIPASLRVLGVPDIAVTPASLAFDSTFTGTVRRESLTVVNGGTDFLEVTSITSSHPALTASPASFSLGPFQSGMVAVTFAPTSAGSVSATLQIHSNDPDRPVTPVSVQAVGVLPPVGSIQPDSVAAWLITGQTQQRTITVRNTGGSVLACSLYVTGMLPPETGAAGPAATGDSKPRDFHPAITHTWQEHASALSPGLLSIAPRRTFDESRLPVLVEDVAGDPPPDLVRLRGGSTGGELRFDIELSGTFVPGFFGGALSIDTDQDPSTGYPPYYGTPGQNVGAEYACFFFTVSLGYVELFSVYTGFIGILPINQRENGFSFAIPLTSIGGDDGAVDIDGVVGTSFGPTDWFPDNGHASTNGAGWLTVEPRSFVLAPGAVMHPQLTIDAEGLFGGDYFAELRVATNEPGPRSVLAMPVRLNVTGAPDIALDRSSLDFGLPFVGAAVTDSVIVTNEGTEILNVAAVTSSSPRFHMAPAGPFAVGPGGSVLVLVTYDAASAGVHSGTLTFTSDDPDEHLTTVAMTGTTLVAPDAGVSPDSLFAEVILGQTFQHTLTLSNTGGSVLRFDIPRPQLNAPTIARSYVPVPKGSLDPRLGPPVTLRRGGPDSYGYTWVDSFDALNGPHYQWVDITNVGTRLDLIGDEDVQYGVPIGFPFPFYGDTSGIFNYFETVNVATNGWMSFNDTREPSYAIYPLPSPYAPSNLIAPFWADLNMRGVRRVYAHNDGTRFIVTWEEVPHFVGGGPYTFQVILDQGGRILFQYKDINVPQAVASIGIQNGRNDTGLQMAFFQLYARDTMAVQLDPPASWLRVDPMAGEVAPGVSTPIHVGFVAEGVSAGNYTGRILIRTNDPDERLIEVGARMRVVVYPDIAADPFDFGETYIGVPVVRPVSIRNDGAAPLLLSGATVTGPFQLISALPASMAPGELRSVNVRFLATAECTPCTGSLVIASNDPDENPFTIALTARALRPPQIAATAALAGALAPLLGPPATSMDRDLEVRNEGGSNLVLRLSTVEGEVSALGSGTDGGSYNWVDSDDPNGPEYLWDDIVSSANRIALSGNDNVATNIPIGFTFTFYGVGYTKVNVSTNGWLSFTDATLPGSHQVALPDAGPATPRNLLAVFWNDLQVPVDRMYAKSFPDRFVVTYRSVNTLPASSPHTFQVVLYNDGRIRYQYQAVQESREIGTVGIQNGAGDVGATVAHDTAYLKDGLAVEFTPGAAWLRFDPPTLTVPPGASRIVRVTFDASTLEPGDYAAAIRLLSNDLDTPELDVPATLHVGSIDAEVRIEPSRFDCHDTQGHGSYPDENGPTSLSTPVNWAENDDNDSEDDHPRKWMRGRVTLPNGFDPQDVAAGNVFAETIRADEGAGVKYSPSQTFTVKFERDLLLEMLPDADNVPVRVIGRIGELTWFSAATTMCLHRPGLHLPAGDTFSAGTRLLLSWSAPAGTTPDHYDLWFTADGENWEKVLAGLTTTTTGWIVPNHVSANARLELFAFDRHTAMGSDRSAPFRITPPTTDALAATGRPGLFNLRSIGPNPTTGDAKLELAVPGPGAVTVTVFDVSGARVRKLVAREFEPGWHTVTWDGTGEDGRLLGAGVYFVRAEHGDRKVNLRVARVR